MESARQDKKFQSSWKLPSSISLDPERKDSPANPYHRSVRGTMTSPKRTVPNASDNESDIVSGLPEFECDVIASSCLSRETRDSSDKTSAVRHRNEDKERREAYWKIKAKVENAVKRHKIFLIRGELPRLKEALEARGWVHKYEPTRMRMLPYGTTAANLEAHSLGDITQADGTLNEKAVIFALLRDRQPDFIWDCRNEFIEWHRSIQSDVILNKYQRSFVYTSKLGMARSLADAYWLHEENVSSVLYPRSYSPSTDRRAFLEDFRLTAAAGLLKWFVCGMNAAEKILVSDMATGGRRAISIARLEFALERCRKFISDATHEDLDADEGEQRQQPSDEEWELFLDDFTAALHHGAGVECSSEDNSERLKRCFSIAAITLERLKTVDPQYNVNGMRGIWILKPSHLCCGNGIVISHSLKDVLRRVEEKPKDYYIVQKYIECPLLIKETKFDIRLWYLVTNTFPLTIWLFKEALLRFSSKPYTFSTYHETIHICNTAVQEKYSEYERRRRLRSVQDRSEESARSVRDQGWDCEKLNEYLKSIGHKGEPYYDQIYPKMAEAIILTMLAAQDRMERRRCSFELYGADFVVAEDKSVWLIEINTNPRMHPPSSRITKRLYDNVLESLVKVIMDVPVNAYADTGGFNLVYKQNIPDFQPYLGPCLFVTGKSMTLRQSQPVEQTPEKEKRANICGPWSSTQQRARIAPPISRSRRSDVVDLIDYFSTVRCTAIN
ncbi:tubulin glycylase 3A-like [Pseudomyrmex gracilis]|uniref:tubulin glycylase 3A-like n=1 Tax=Pseudomyrmex gracilis TaxID=219809 RepID=UPI000994CBC1|nr:tubulin glycylase 3A-like [Pseudomyrmex gracilis]XP_020300320.1 tubulin glycylase 3A-like [Pseudomyrmex gracilis]